MKTVTEFSGSLIQRAIAVRERLLKEGIAVEQIAEPVGTELAVSGDRLSRLIEALEAVGDRSARVRLVRVFAAEHEPKGAKKVGEFHFVIDLQPDVSQRQSDKKRHGRGGRAGRSDRGPGGRSDRSPGAADHREPRGPLPSGGAGWALTRTPTPPGERRRPGGKGRRAGRPTGAPGAPGSRPPGAPGGPRSGRPGGGPGGRPPRQAPATNAPLSEAPKGDDRK